MLYVGVDGGGSTCRVRVRDGAGALCSVAEGGAANVYLDFEGALRTIAATVAEALAGAGAAAAEARLGLGLAGVSDAAASDRVRDALAGYAGVAVTHDGDIACLGAHAGADGGLIIAGTGSAAVARVDGRSIAIGGRGFILGDDGSGARLGQEAVREALRAHDGLVAHTVLSRRIMTHFGDDPVTAISWGRQARSADFARLAPWIIEAAASGDQQGTALVGAAAAAIAQLAETLHRLGAARLSFVGGLAPALTPYLPEPLRRDLQPPLRDALDGALLLAGCPLPALA